MVCAVSVLGALLKPIPDRRQALAAAVVASGSAVLPAQSLVHPFDPKAAAGPRGLFKSADIDVPKGPGVSNSGILLLREAFDGETPAEGLVEWYERHLAADFEAVFAGGNVRQTRSEFIEGT